jgi:excisionase family DNA binding protein
MGTAERLIFSIGEVCKATGLGATLIREQIKKGELQAIKVGRRTMVTREALAEYISSREVAFQ